MAEHDIQVTAGHALFSDVILDHPLLLAGGSVDRVTMAQVELTITNAHGSTARGVGASMLSVPWSWPSATPFGERDARMRALTTALTERVVGMPGGDPFALWSALSRAAIMMPAAAGLPPLAVLLCVAAVDNALHDGWSRAAGMPLYPMYTPEVLTAAGRDVIDPELPPLALERSTPRSALPVQHVVGLSDSLDVDSALATAILRDGVRHLKLKLRGDAAADGERVVAIHDLFADHQELELSLDANEGYRDAAEFRALVGGLRERRPAAWAAVSYIEQPVPRDVDDVRDLYPPHMPPAERRPLLLDEGHISPAQLESVAARGWAGIVVKASKGQSLAILSHAFARAHDLVVMTQDLTSVDLALEHSAGLAATLPFSSEAFECNSLQYAPSANARLAERNPALVTIRDGAVRPGPSPSRGLYADDAL